MDEQVSLDISTFPDGSSYRDCTQDGFRIDPDAKTDICLWCKRDFPTECFINPCDARTASNKARSIRLTPTGVAPIAEVKVRCCGCHKWTTAFAFPGDDAEDLIGCCQKCSDLLDEIQAAKHRAGVTA